MRYEYIVDYFKQKEIDYEALDSSEAHTLEIIHRRGLRKYVEEREVSDALNREGPFKNKVGTKLLSSRVYVIFNVSRDMWKKRNYIKLEKLVVEDTTKLFLEIADKEFKKHKSVDRVSYWTVEEKVRDLLNLNAGELDYIEINRKNFHEVLKERYSLGSRFKRFFTRSASENQIAQLENRIARLEKHNKTARTSDFFKKYVHAKNPSIVKIKVLEEAVSVSGSGYAYLVRGKVLFGGFHFFIFHTYGRGKPDLLLQTKDFKKALLTFDKVASREDIH